MYLRLSCKKIVCLFDILTFFTSPHALSVYFKCPFFTRLTKGKKVTYESKLGLEFESLHKRKRISVNKGGEGVGKKEKNGHIPTTRQNHGPLLVVPFSVKKD